MTPTINSIYKIMVLHVPEIPPKVPEIVTLSWGEGLGKTTLSLSKDVTIRWGRGSKARVTMSFYMTFFYFEGVPYRT